MTDPPKKEATQNLQQIFFFSVSKTKQNELYEQIIKNTTDFPTYLPTNLPNLFCPGLQRGNI